MAVTRRTVLTGSLGLVVGTGLTTCARSGPEIDPGTVTTGAAPTLALGNGGAAVASRLALALWSRASVVVVLRAGPLDAGAARPAADAARALRVPLLVEGPELAATVRRLQVTRAVAYPDAAGLALPGVRVSAGVPTDDLADLDLAAPHGPPLPVIRVLGPPSAASGMPALLAHAVGATPLGRHADPRAEHATVAALRAAPRAGVLVTGDADGKRLAKRLRTARKAPELPIPGGGQLPLQDRVLVALYGHPQTSALGLLGEQDVEAAIRRAKRWAKDYQELTDLTQAEKQATWARIRERLPAGVHLGWKNFIDEDRRMLTPEQTWTRVSPHPSLITYQ